MDKVLVRQLKNLKNIKPSTSLLESQRSFLLSEISKNEPKKSLVLPLFHFNILKILKPNFAIALAIIILFSSFGTIGAISFAQNSLPGDFLYPVKTAFEQTQMTFTSGEENQVKLSIKFANHRIDEFTQLIDNSDKKQDVKKSAEEFKAQLVSVQDRVSKLKETNSAKAIEVAKLVKAQTEVYKETLIHKSDELAYIIPGDNEEVKENINQVFKEIEKTNKLMDGLIPENEEVEEIIEEINPEEIIVPVENIEEDVQSGSFDGSE
ncbi:hypothetical protein KKA23_00610 [Patescibacteria group bacterium]|nr:hypothetical protein [Patescibacteria group bacterium]